MSEVDRRKHASCCAAILRVSRRNFWYRLLYSSCHLYASHELAAIIWKVLLPDEHTTSQAVKVALSPVWMLLAMVTAKNNQVLPGSPRECFHFYAFLLLGA